MPVYLCRWPNGDVSLAAGESEVEVSDVLDEVDNPDAAELMQLDHAIAVHFKLGTRPGEEGTLPLLFEDMSEQLESSICERAYPVYNEVRAKTDPTIKELTEALKHEKNPIYRKAPEPSANPSVAPLQDELQMPRVVLGRCESGRHLTKRRCLSRSRKHSGAAWPHGNTLAGSITASQVILGEAGPGMHIALNWYQNRQWQPLRARSPIDTANAATDQNNALVFADFQCGLSAWTKSRLRFRLM